MTSLSFAALAAAQQSRRAKDSATAVRRRIYVDAKAIAASTVIVKDEVSYADFATFAEALEACLQSGRMAC